LQQIFTALPLLFIFVLWGKCLKTFFSPSCVITGTWSIFLLAHLLLAPDYKFSYEAGLVIDILIFAFFSGELIVNILTRNYFKNINKYVRTEQLYDNKFKKRLKLTIIILGSISIIGSLLYFYIFYRHFGSFTNLFTAGWLIREEIGAGLISVPFAIRFITLIAYSVVLLSLVYWIRYGFKFFIMMPFVSILIMGITQAARAGTFMMLIIIFVASCWKDIFNGLRNVGFRFTKRVLFFSFIILSIFIVGLMYREQNFTLDLIDNRQLKVFRIYAFGAISGFSEFIEAYNFESSLTLGLYSFSSLFELLGIQKLAFGFYDEYLFISNANDDYTNVYTIFRSLIEDFGIIGSIFYMFTLGCILAFYFKLAIKKNLPAIAFICIMYTLLVYSVIAPLTQHNSLLLSFIMPPLIISIITSKYKSKVNHKLIVNIDTPPVSCTLNG